MRQASTHQILGTTALLLALFSPAQLDWQTSLQTNHIQLQSDRAEAKSSRSSGGRSSGGSFNRRSSGSGSSGSGSSGSGSSGSGSPRRSTSYDDDYYPRTRTIYRDNYYYRDRHYGYHNGRSNSGDILAVIIIILLVIGAVALAIYLIKISMRGKSGQPKELQNDIVTVTQLQVAVLDGCDLQETLSQITRDADTDSPEGLQELLKESALALLRSPEAWSSAYSQSQTVKTRERATELFEQLEIIERSKIGSETLVNVGGRVRETGYSGSEDTTPGYIVMTLLVGSEDDKPLFEPVRTHAQLQAALQRLAGLSVDYLLTVELLWSPQNHSDNLSQDDFLMLYPEMIPLI
jgi:uncharacterized membrane protein